MRRHCKTSIKNRMPGDKQNLVCNKGLSRIILVQ